MSARHRIQDGAEVVVVGGGIAGLAVACWLARSGSGDLLLVEQEPVLAAHASGRNAAIYRPLDRDPVISTLAGRSRELLRSLGADSLIRPTGLLLVAEDAARVEHEAAAADRAGLAYELHSGAALARLAPPLGGGAAAAGVLLPEGGVMDIHGVTTTLSRAARAAGARVVTRIEVRRIVVSGGRVDGLELGDGTRIPCHRAVIAAGAWAAPLGEASGCPLPLTPRRRHLMHLSGEIPPEAPVVWCLDEEVYFRAEAGGVLASPCDAEPWSPGAPPVDPEQLAEGARKLERVAPALAGAHLRRAWACLRTATPDGALVAGADGRVEGLFWLAGLGGHGMTVGVAAGELVANRIRGLQPPLLRRLEPARLLRREFPPTPPPSPKAGERPRPG